MPRRCSAGAVQIIASGIKALQGFALLVAAIVHDYRHRGVNNGYLIKVRANSTDKDGRWWLFELAPLPTHRLSDNNHIHPERDSSPRGPRSERKDSLSN